MIALRLVTQYSNRRNQIALFSSEAKKKKKTKKERRAEKKGDAGIEMLVRNIGVKDKVEKIDFTRKKGTAQTLTETYFLCNVEDKDLHLYYMLLTHPGKTLVFANSIDGVMNLVSFLRNSWIRLLALDRIKIF